MAVAAAQSLPSGTHVAMNGMVLPWNRMERQDDGRFARKTG